MNLVHRPIVLLAAWTLFVWGLRSRNLTDDEVDVGLAQIVPVLGFIVIGLLLVVIVWRARQRHLVPAERALVRAAAVVIGLYWLVRGVEIFFDDHSAAFIAVHTVLAIVSVGLASWTILTIAGDHRELSGHRPKAKRQ